MLRSVASRFDLPIGHWCLERDAARAARSLADPVWLEGPDPLLACPLERRCHLGEDMDR